MKILMCVAIAFWSGSVWGTVVSINKQSVDTRRVSNPDLDLKPIRTTGVSERLDSGQRTSFLKRDWINRSGRPCALYSYSDDTFGVQCFGFVPFGAPIRELQRYGVLYIEKRNEYEIGLMVDK